MLAVDKMVKRSAQDGEAKKAESWDEKNQQIVVQEGNGFLYNLQMTAKVDSSPSVIYGILTDPAAVSVFRNLKACVYRNILEDDGKGRRKLEVQHRAIARFLFISMTFETTLHVWEDDHAKRIKFRNARDGFMKKFDGTWVVQPFTEQNVQGLKKGRQSNDSSQQAPHHVPWLNPGSVLSGLQAMHSRFHSKEASSSLVTLEQAILPKAPAPPGVKHLIRALCAKQIRDMMEDLRKEADKRTAAAAPGLQPTQPASHRTSKGAKAAAAASLTLAHGTDIWDMAAPINITIRL
mmetsp:Transcript_37941/g.84526  ORF Transcript_37941/g.84526 Transcript_37941/m.84526 type:complete len:292 (+) Transcript_37941:39-914(+)